jgi:hypothetical protein
LLQECTTGRGKSDAGQAGGAWRQAASDVARISAG